MRRPELQALVLSLAITGVACSDSSTTPTDPPPASPAVVTVERSTHPVLPEELKATCLLAPEGSASAPVCPTLVWNGRTYWALSFGDNRSSMAIVAFDDDGNVVERWDREGARYIWQIQIDDAAQTVHFVGQVERTITMSWEELGIEG